MRIGHAYQKCRFYRTGADRRLHRQKHKETVPEASLIAATSGEETLRQAHADGLIENDTFLPLEDFATCDLLFLCSPVTVNLSYLRKLKPVLAPRCLLTDVGSVKGDIARAVKDLGLEKQFIGGHPMAGSEAIGYEHSSEYLLENAYYILTPGEGVPEETFRDFYQLVKQMELSPFPCPGQARFLHGGYQSSSPCGSGLPGQSGKEADDENATLKTIAAGGFRDITRIASSSPVMWQNICLTNQREILHLLDLYLEKLQTFRTELANADSENLLAEFQSAKDYRDNLPIHQPGILPSVYEFYCDLIDEAGGIATIATILATNQLSIKNIGIIHNREYQDGVLHIEMYDQPSLEAAVALLQRNHYTIHL